MKPLKRALISMVPTIVAVSILSYLTVTYCTSEELKWTPFIIVVTMVFIMVVALVNAILQDLGDKPESIL